MSPLDHLLLWLHIGFAIFALGPLTAVTSVTPRYIRAREIGVLRYLHRSTRLFGLLTIGVFLFGLLLGRSALGAPYLSVSMTLFVVAAVLLVIVERDQRTAIEALSTESPADDAKVQTGRIAALGGISALIWLVILFLMVFFNP
ncbi:MULTISPECIES: hypothetical protein [Microbispora]|uniref:DUF2269 family protein n=3 Tax=Microbispora TaxID=2005 RepID=A0ABY3M4C6_9ACTN|nr:MULTISPECIES: hypothetical protein [Microbispora]GLW26355.1 hypothetical protein Mame01_63970 [Microbispora amethystogenes]MBO4274805.1 hypothetical protein [Microbispora triticiradicis]RGA01644.1 hypothetical protein DI270_028630 [Microbispora triticiradicis]TLP56938.1 hypothetical protein FED44_21090 [Microbispora fusca]TYB66893.1 hypothetical protein FXF59_03530 [Microbispora tritici]